MKERIFLLVSPNVSLKLFVIESAASCLHENGGLQSAGSQRCKIVVRLLHTDFHALTPYYICRPYIYITSVERANCAEFPI